MWVLLPLLQGRRRIPIGVAFVQSLVGLVIVYMKKPTDFQHRLTNTTQGVVNAVSVSYQAKPLAYTGYTGYTYVHVMQEFNIKQPRQVYFCNLHVASMYIKSHNF